MVMLAVSFLSWWYGKGWRQVAASFPTRLRGVADTFSVSQLAKTLFAPWRRIISYGGDAFADRVRAWADNLISRVIGSIVRLTVIIAALLVMLLTAAITLIELVLWPLLPLAAPVLIIAGFF